MSTSKIGLFEYLSVPSAIYNDIKDKDTRFTGSVGMGILWEGIPTGFSVGMRWAL